jgi:hypothetical protein
LFERIMGIVTTLAFVNIRELADQMEVPFGREFRLAWNAANTTLHANSLGFVPARMGAFTYAKATTKQKRARSERFRKAALR